MSAPVSPKVTAASTAAAASTLVVSTLAAHVFHGSVPGDVLRLAEATVTAAFTFAAGWLAKHVPAPVADAVAKAASE